MTTLRFLAVLFLAPALAWGQGSVGGVASGKIIVGNSNGKGVPVTPSGVVAISNTGVFSFGSFTSATLATALSDENGSGKIILADGTLSITSGKTLTATNTLTLAGTDGSTLNIGSGGTLAALAYVASPVPVANGGNGVSTLPIVHAHKTSTQTVNNSTAADLSFVEVNDSGGNFSTPTFTAPRAGLLKVTYHFTSSTALGGGALLWCLKNGNYDFGSEVTVPVGTTTRRTVTWVFPVTTSDTVKLQFQNDTGANVDIIAGNEITFELGVNP